MIAFKKLRTKRIKPFKVLDDEAPVEDDESLAEIERSDWKQKPANKIQISDGSDTAPNRASYGCYRSNLSENKISSDEKELSVPVKRKVSYHPMDNSDCSPVSAKIRRFSEDEDSESGEIEDSPKLFQHKGSEVKISDVRCTEGGYSQDVNMNNLNSGEKKSFDDDRHLLSQIPPTEKKKWPQKPCILCRRYGVRHDTRYYCKDCNAALCKEPCFREYHSM